MTSVGERIEIDVPVSTAYNEWTQFEEFPRFMEGIEEIGQRDDVRLHWHAEIAGFDPEGFVESAGDALGVVAHRAKGDLERFKAFIESRGMETGGWRGDVPRHKAS